jgi:hypothetical protein
MFDCGLFTAGALEAMTGVDLGARFRGKYAGNISAEKAMRRFCGGDLERLAETIAKEYELKEVAPRMAQRGDAVLIGDGENGPALGVIDIRGNVAVTVSAAGLAYRDRESILRAWRV